MLKGRVRDAAGAPIGEARVIVGKGRIRRLPVPGLRQYFAEDRHDGCERPLRPRRALRGHKNLAVDKRGYVTLVRKDFTWPADDTELEFTLETGFTLTVKVVEADGTPIRDLDVSVTTPGLPEWCQDNKAPGVYAFADFPKGAVATISTQWATKTWTRTVPVRSDVTETITMPATGKIEIDYGAIEGEAFVVELRGRDLPADRRPNWIFEAAKAGSPRTFLAEPVLPGDYEAALLQLRPRNEERWRLRWFRHRARGRDDAHHLQETLTMTLTRDEAWTHLCEWTETDSLRKHARAVELVMRAAARRTAAPRRSRASGASPECSTTATTSAGRRIIPSASSRGFARGERQELADAISTHYTKWGTAATRARARAASRATS